MQKVEEGRLYYETLDGDEGTLGLDFAMLLPPFRWPRTCRRETARAMRSPWTSSPRADSLRSTSTTPRSRSRNSVPRTGLGLM